jgi:cytochrome c
MGYSMRVCIGVVLVAAGSVLFIQSAEAAAVKPAAVPAGDVEAGAALFKQRCGVCHSVSDPPSPGVGPNLRTVVGRPAASQPGFNYSAALKASKISWTAQKLSDFLAAPQAMVKGTMMVINVPKAEERANMIAYLASLKK